MQTSRLYTHIEHGPAPCRALVELRCTLSVASTGRSPRRPLLIRRRRHGLARKVLVGPAQGAVHTELAVGSLQPGGWLARHIHSFEEACTSSRASSSWSSDGHVHQLVPGDFALVPIATMHTLACAGSDAGALDRREHATAAARRTRRSATRSSPASHRPGGSAGGRASPCGGDPSVRWVGHYDGTPPQLEALRLDDPARGRRPAGMDTALLAYSGISVKMLVDRTFGADLLTMFTVDYEVGGAAQAHDHPFEEAYFFLAGACSRPSSTGSHTRSARATSSSQASARSTASGTRAGARPLDRDAGAAAARAPRLSLGADVAGRRRPGVEAWPVARVAPGGSR